MKIVEQQTFSSVYGPVRSWRFGLSLGIDPIGPESNCSFNCVYCQLGEIRHHHRDRQIFVPTSKIQHDLQSFSFENVNTITLSGSGEPTLAQNLGEILPMVKHITGKPVGVLTNGSLLSDRVVCEELAIADWVAVKLDAVSADMFYRINRPIPDIHLEDVWAGLLQFRQMYLGHLAIQTMLLIPWSDEEQAEYIQRMQTLLPDEIQLNTPTRPKPMAHQLEARGNHSPETYTYPTRQLKRVSAEVLQRFVDRLQKATGIPVRHPLLKEQESKDEVTAP